MKKINRIYVYPILITLLLLALVFIIGYKNQINENNLNILQNSITDSLDYYSNDSSLVTYTYKEIESEEILDFDVETYNSVTEENSTIDFFFSNNKLSFLLDSIISNKNDSLEKYFYINFFESEHLNNNLDLSDKILNNISYLPVVSLDEKYYNYKDYSQELIIKKYFLLSSLKNNGYKEVENLEKIVFEDIKNNFSLYDNNSKLKLLFFLYFSGELDNFLQETNFKLDSIEEKNNSYYIYLAEKLELDDDIENLSNNLYSDFSSLTDLEKILFIGYLYESGSEDFLKYYKSFEEKNNYNLELEAAFIKYLVYSKFDNEYSSFENEIKFWYTSGILINRKKEFILDYENKNHIDSLHMNRVMYDGLIDTRVVSFEGDKFYLNIIVKEIQDEKL